MPVLRTHCPNCNAESDLVADEILLVTQPVGAATYAYVCCVCEDLAVAPADPRALLVLGSIGVTPLRPVVRHPENPPAGPPFVPDDLLDLHALLGQPDWFEQLATAPTR